MSLDKIKNHTLDTILLKEGFRFEGLIKSKKSDKQIIDNLKTLGYSLVRKFYERSEASEVADNLAAEFKDFGRQFRRDRIEHYVSQSYDKYIEHINKFKTPNIITIYKEIYNEYMKPLKSINFSDLQNKVDFSNEKALKESILGQIIEEQIKLSPLEDAQRDEVREALFSTLYRIFAGKAKEEIGKHFDNYCKFFSVNRDNALNEVVLGQSTYQSAISKGVNEKHLPKDVIKIEPYSIRAE